MLPKRRFWKSERTFGNAHHMLLVKLLQKIAASQENQPIASHATIFCNHLAKLLQKIVASNENQHITCCYHLLQSSCKVVTKDSSIPENQHITCCYYPLLCNHLAKFMLPNEDFRKPKNVSDRRFLHILKKTWAKKCTNTR